MRKLSGLFIAAAVTGVALWQLPEQSQKKLAAQTARSSSSDSASGGRSRQSNPLDEAARSTLKLAQDSAAKGDIAKAKKLALEASRFPVQWGPREMSPQQFLDQLSRGGAATTTARPGGLNPSAVAARPGAQDGGVVTAGGTRNAPVFEQTAYEETSRPISGMKAGLRQRVDEYLQNAEAARREGDRDEAIRLAKVAEMLATNVAFGADEETPTQYLKRILSEPAIAPASGAKSFGSAGRSVGTTTEKSPPTEFMNSKTTAKPLNLAKKPNPFDDEAEAPTTNTTTRPAPLPKAALDNNPFEDGVAEPPVARPAVKSTEPGPLYTGRLSKPATPVVEENPFGDDSESSKPQPAPNSKLKQQAANLMSTAREEMQGGRFDSAYQKALLASQMDVTWNLLEEQPRQLMAEIQRRQQRAIEQAESFVDSTPEPKKAVAADNRPQALPFDEEVEAPVPKPTTRPSAAAGLTSTSTPSAKTPSPGKGALGDREHAKHLIAEAKQHLAEGHFDEARSCALRAQALNLSYGIFEERPEHILREVDRAAGTVTLTRGGNSSDVGNKKSNSKSMGPATATQSAAQAAFDQNKARAQKLMADAKQAIAQGDLDQARQLATEAKQYEATFELFDDRPEVILTDIERRASRATSVPKASAKGNFGSDDPLNENPFSTQLSDNQGTRSLPDSALEPARNTNGGAAAKQRQQQANQLVAESRQLLKQGDLEGAREKAEAAQQLNVAFDLFSDQPEHVLSEIERIERNARTGNARVARNQPAAEEVPTPSFDEPAATPKVDNRKMAQQLLSQARQELEAGNLQQAAHKAQQVQAMDLTFGPRDDRPELVLTAIQEAWTQQQAATPSEPQRLTASGRSMPSNPAPFAINEESSPIAPSGQSANDLYRTGETLLRKGDRAKAYQAFLAAAQSGQKLDPYKAQRMQDYLRELAPRNSNRIQLTSAQEADGTNPAARDFDNARPINEAEQQDQLRFDRLRTEVLNAIVRADTLREKRPDEAVEVLDKAMADVENSGFDKQRVATLVSQLRRTRGSIEGLIAQKAPILELEKRNSEVRNLVNQARTTQVRIRKEFATLVDEFNQHYRAKDYAKAAVAAKQAKDLDPENPVAVEMDLKAKFAMRDASNKKLRDGKEEMFWDVLNDVEYGLVTNVPTDEHPVKFNKKWKEMSEMRKGRYPTDYRSRSEDEKRIEESLSKKVSLQYENAPLQEVVSYLRSAADINIAIDGGGLEDEGVTTNTPVSVHLDNISVKSALKLVLGPLHLGYSIEDDVLKVTSRVKQQGRLVAAAYPVADLVTSMRHITNSPNTALGTPGLGNALVTPNAGPRGFFQVGGGNNPAAAFSNGNTPEVTTNGGAENNYDFHTLVDLITSVVEPDSWTEVGGHGSIKSNETTLSLVIRQTQQVHQEIIDLLEQLRRLQDLQITIEVRLINVSDRFFERIGVDFDFDFQDTVGGPFFSAGGAGGQAGGQGGQQNNQNQAGSLVPLPPFGSQVLGGGQNQNGQGQNQQGQGQGQAGQAAQAGGGGLTFGAQPQRNLVERDNWGRGTIVGLRDANQSFTNDLDIGFQQGSFDLGVPDFGGFQPNAGLQVGLAILSDIETFFFIQAAQGDERSNLLFAPKVTLFNGGTATISDTTQRPYVASLQPTVGAFSVGLTPNIQTLSDGITLSVSAVASADRRFVRLGLAPQFSNLIEIQTFAFQGGGQGGAQAGGQQGQGGGQQGFGGQGGQQGGFGGQGGGQFGFGGIGGGPMMMEMAQSNRLGHFGRGMSGSDLTSTMNPMMGFGGIGGFGGQGQGGQGQGGQGQQGQQGQGAGGTTTLQQPIIEQISVQTVVTVPDGGTVLLGGMKRLREGRNMTGVPILNKLPYISRLFKNSGVGRETESLMLMVTPRIIIFEEEEQLLGVELD